MQVGYGEHPVLTATGSGVDRFYVVNLTSLNGTSYSWYAGALENGISDYSIITSTDFGSGYANTEKMIEKWNAGAYGAKNAGSNLDLWSAVSDAFNKGWFVPSYDETSVWYREFEAIHYGSWGSLGFPYIMWTSSLRGEKEANFMQNWYAGTTESHALDIARPVYLATTF